jgi:pyruvate kinase
MAEHKITEKMISQLNALMLKRHFAQKGDRIVIVSGSPVGVKGSTNLLKIHEVQ